MRAYDIIPFSRAKSATYTYLVDSETTLSIGTIVEIEFGRTRILGMVHAAAVTHPKLKQVIKVYPVQLGPVQYELARWLATEYLAPLGLVLKLFVAREYLKDLSVSPPARGPRAVVRPPQLLMTANRFEQCRELLRNADDCQKNSLLTVPDVALAKAWYDRLKPDIPGIVLWHSRLKRTERRAIWQCIALGEPTTVISTRSGVFLPWPSLGTIVVDEEDDLAYKNDQTPRWHVRPVAAKLAELTGARLYYGSVAPSLETYRVATQSGSMAHIAPDQIRVVDTRRHRRRGELTYELWQALTDHQDKKGLILLHAPARYHQVILDETKDEFSSLNPQIFNPETPRQLTQIKQGATRLLVGGQNITRQWWLEPILIGSINLDSFLQLPDFRGEEKFHATIRKLAAVLGPDGTLLVQTETPDHSLFGQLSQPYNDWAQEELRARKLLRLPPYERLTRLLFSSESAASQALAALAERGLTDATLQSSPGVHSAAVLIKGDPKRLAELLEPGWSVDVDPVTF